MKKIVGLGAAALTIPAGVAAAVLIHPAVALSDPPIGSLYVVGEQYGKALQILQSQNATTLFGGSVGSDLPQSQCIVAQQTPVVGVPGKFRLTLDCTRAAYEDAMGPLPKGVIPGGNGVTTITLTPVPRALNPAPPPLNP